MHHRLAFLGLLAACTPATDEVADDTDAEETDTDVEETDTEDVDTDAEETDDETDAPHPCPLPTADSTVDIGADMLNWVVADDPGIGTHLKSTTPLEITGLSPGDEVAFRVTLPGTLTMLKETTLLLWAEPGGSRPDTEYAITRASGRDAGSDFAGATWQLGANNDWAFVDAVGDEAYFYGTFVYADEVPGGTDGTCFTWVYTVPETATASGGGTVSVNDPLTVWIDEFQVQVSALGVDSSEVLAWTPAAAGEGG